MARPGTTDYSKWAGVAGDEDLTVLEENVDGYRKPQPCTRAEVLAAVAAATGASISDEPSLGLDRLRWLVRVGRTRPDFPAAFTASGDRAPASPVDGWRAFFGCYSCENSTVWDERAPVPDAVDDVAAPAIDAATRRLTALLAAPVSAFFALERALGAAVLRARTRRATKRGDDPRPVAVHVLGLTDEEPWLVLQQLLGGKDDGPRLFAKPARWKRAKENGSVGGDGPRV